MPYRIKSNELAPQGVRRIVREQIERAIKELTDAKSGRRKRVHRTRKRFKKTRGVLRLVRSELGPWYLRENVRYRDLGRDLSPMRDAQTMTRTFDALIRGHPKKSAVLKPVRIGLVERRRRVLGEQVDFRRCVEKMAADLRQAKKRVKSWPLRTDTFQNPGCGLKKNYRRGRKALACAYKNPTSAHFHEWRKVVKYHGYHIRLLKNVWPEAM